MRAGRVGPAAALTAACLAAAAMAAAGEKVVLKGHDGAVRCLAFAPSGQFIASGGMDGAVRLWHARTGQCIRVLPAHQGAVRQIVVSPNSRGVASAGADGAVKVWSAQSGNLLWQSAGQGAEDRPPSVAFAPDTRYVAVGRASGHLAVCDLKTQQLTSLTAPDGDASARAVTALAFGPGGTTLAAATGVPHPAAGDTGQITLWNLGTGQADQTIETAAPVAALAFPAGGDLLVSGLASGQIVQWRAANGTTGRVFDHDAPLHGLSVSRTGKRLLTVGRTELRLWNLAEEKVTVLTAEPPATFESAALSPNGTRIASAGSGGGAIKVWPVAKAQGTTTTMDELDAPAPGEEARIAAQIDILGMQMKDLEDQIKRWKDVAAKRSVKRSKGDMPMNQMSFPALLAIQKLTIQKAELLRKVQALQDKLRRMKKARKQNETQDNNPDDEEPAKKKRCGTSTQPASRASAAPSAPTSRAWPSPAMARRWRWAAPTPAFSSWPSARWRPGRPDPSPSAPPPSSLPHRPPAKPRPSPSSPKTRFGTSECPAAVFEGGSAASPETRLQSTG